jgi:hypothetical protein
MYVCMYVRNIHRLSQSLFSLADEPELNNGTVHFLAEHLCLDLTWLYS